MKNSSVLKYRILILLAVLIISVGIDSYFSSTKLENSPQNEVKKETHKFPVYPGAFYLKSEPVVCPSPYPSAPECGFTSYVWETTQEIRTVTAWYKENTINSKWKLTGGGGSAGSVVIDNYESNEGKVTLILSASVEQGQPTAFKTKIQIIPIR